MRPASHRPRTAAARAASAVAASAAAVLAASLLAACTGDGDQERAERSAGETMTGLAQGLAGGDLDDVRISDASPASATTQLESLVAGMRDGAGEQVVPLVRAGDVNVDAEGGTGTATLTWTWPLGSTEWTYTSPVLLGDTGDGWAVEWGPEVVEPSLLDGERLRVRTIAPERGDLLDGDGAPLVTLRPVLRFGLDKALLDETEAAASARQLAGRLDIDPAAYAERVAAAGERAFVEAIVLREEDGDVTVANGIKGATALPGELPLAPTRDFAAPILGSVGEATAEIVEESQGAVAAGDLVGRSGLQARYDDQLRGRKGVLVEAVGEADDAEPRELHREEATAGEPLQLTLDVRAQRVAEQALAGLPAGSGGSAAVVLRPSDGAVLAAANGAGNDGQNLATFGQFAPGSTFKVVTSLALLRSGVGPDDAVPCTDSITVDGRRFTNYSDYPSSGIGRISLTTALANSCNTAFIASADRLGPDRLAQAAAALGLGVDHDLGFPAFFGQVPAPESQTEAAAEVIGQGRVLAAPLTMASVAASVRAGEAVVPRLLVDHETPVVEPAEPLTADEAEQLRAMMRAVVTEGSGRQLADVPGDPVGAKTGTAEFGSGDELDTHAWMIAQQGDLAVAVFVERGESGSRTAGPVLAEILDALASGGR